MFAGALHTILLYQLRYQWYTLPWHNTTIGCRTMWFDVYAWLAIFWSHAKPTFPHPSANLVHTDPVTTSESRFFLPARGENNISHLDYMTSLGHVIFFQSGKTVFIDGTSLIIKPNPKIFFFFFQETQHKRKKDDRRRNGHGDYKMRLGTNRFTWLWGMSRLTTSGSFQFVFFIYIYTAL